MMTKPQLCPALIVSAPSSGSGKTTITAAIARYHRQQGRIVTVFKVGPDFIDPMILQQASGQRVYQLDLWLVGESACRDLIYQAACQSDLILIEGVMGLFDGTPSSADLARLFGIPVLAVIDASAMAQTFAAIAYGLAHYDSQLPFAGVIANRVNSERHESLLKQSLSQLDKQKQIKFYGRVGRDSEISLPERHLGLVQAKELADIDAQLDLASAHIAKTDLARLPKAVKFQPSDSSAESNAHITDGLLKNKRIIVINDKAFSFIYAANIDFLTEAGADIIYASALEDTHLPEGDALYIPGGYPELYAAKLAENTSFIQDVRAFSANQKPILAECGGMLYLMDQLTDLDNQTYDLVGLIPGQARMQNKLAAIGSQWVEFPFESALLAGNQMRGHSFHYSTANVNLPAQTKSVHHPSERQGEDVYIKGNIIASYMHWYFHSNPALASLFFMDKTVR